MRKNIFFAIAIKLTKWEYCLKKATGFRPDGQSRIANNFFLLTNIFVKNVSSKIISSYDDSF